MGLNLRFFLFVLGRSKAHGRGGNSCIKSHGRRVDREPRLVKVFYYQRLALGELRRIYREPPAEVRLWTFVLAFAIPDSA